MTTTKKRRGVEPPSRNGWPERLAYLRDQPDEWDKVKTCNSAGSARTIAARVRKYVGPEFEVTARSGVIYARFHETEQTPNEGDNRNAHSSGGR